jgi:phosphatidylinositol glycan class N
LDTWVFERVKRLFHAAAKNATLDTALRENQNVFFLHLLGLDTAGHAYRPYSKEYLHNIKVVDRGVEEITNLIDEFYGDGKTAFVFTADHGMTDWGSHGDGHPDNTRTPLIAWGSGVAKPNLTESGRAPGHEDGFSADWGLDHVQRHDVSQADVAALMAYLVGLEFPVNSVGELPLSYVAGDLKEKAEAALANARGVMEMYRVKEEQKRRNELRYQPFPALGDEDHSVHRRVTEIMAAIDDRQYDRAISKSQELLHLGLDGLRYLQTYDWLFLRALITVGYLGWIAFAITTVMDLHVLRGGARSSRTASSPAVFGALSASFFSFLWIRNAPVTFYAYTLFPLFFWEEVFARREALIKGSYVLFEGVHSRKEFISLGIKAFAFVGLLEALVGPFRYSGHL